MNFEDDNICDCETVFHLANLLNIDVKKLLFFAYKNAGLYNHYKIKKSSGGEREISAPIEALKTINRKLTFQLNEIYSEHLPSSVHGFVSDRSIVTNAKNHLNKRYVLNIDLENFFGTINSGRVMGLLRGYPFNFNKSLASVITGITTYNNSLPQGAPSSPVISNMICRKLDMELIKLAKENSWVYSRYADDITISTNVLTESLASKIKEDVILGIEIRKIIKRNGFSINKAKIRLARPNQSKWVTGVKVNNELNVSRKFIRQVRSMLYSLEKSKTTIDILSNPETLILLNIVRGKISHVGNVKSKENLTYIKLYNRLCELEGKVHKRIPESLKEKYKENVLVIKTSLGYASGFFIRENVIVTAAHTIGLEERSVDITTRRMRLPVEFKGANVIFVDRAKDFAILYTISSSFSKAVFDVDFGDRSFDHDIDYVSVGYGGFRSNLTYWSDVAVVDQKIVQIENLDGNINYHVNSPMWSGMSGGPVISQKTGSVVGYITFGSPSLNSGQEVKNHVFRSISNIPLEYRPVKERTGQLFIPF